MQQIDVSFMYLYCPLIDDYFRHNIVKIAVDPRGASQAGRALLHENRSQFPKEKISFVLSSRLPAESHDVQGVYIKLL